MMNTEQAIEVLSKKISCIEQYFSKNDKLPKEYDAEFVSALGVAVDALKKDVGRKVIYTTDKTHPQMCPNCGNKLERPYHHCIFCGQNLRYPDNRKNIIDQIKPHGPVPCWNYKKGPEPKC